LSSMVHSDLDKWDLIRRELALTRTVFRRCVLGPPYTIIWMRGILHHMGLPQFIFSPPTNPGLAVYEEKKHVCPKNDDLVCIPELGLHDSVLRLDLLRVLLLGALFRLVPVAVAGQGVLHLWAVLGVGVLLLPLL